MEMVSLQKFFKLLFIFLLDANLENLIIILHVFIISSMLVKFQVNQRSIALSSIKCLNFKFFGLNLCIKNKFINRIVNNI